MLDVLILTKRDWANSAYRFSKSLENLGLSVKGYRGHEHQFKYFPSFPIKKELSRKGKYPEDNIHPYVLKCPELKDLMEEAKIIYFFHGVFVDTGIDLSKKKVIVQHGGHNRPCPEKFNKIFNPIVSHTILQCPDLLGLGAKNEVLIYYPVDTNFIKPDYYPHDEKILIGHYPSNPETKGTGNILPVIEKLENDPSIKDKFQYIGNREIYAKNINHCIWEEQLEKIRKCDIIIETVNLSLKGKKYGEWANTALEAAASGCAVITNSLTTEIYKQEYGDCALNIANDKETLEEHLRKLINMSKEELLFEKRKTRDWVIRNHSNEATGKRLWNKVFQDLLK